MKAVSWLGVHRHVDRPPVDQAGDAELPIAVWRLMNRLSYREREVLKLRFGLDGGGKRTLQSIAELWSVQRDRVRSIESRATFKLARLGRPLTPFYFHDRHDPERVGSCYWR